MSLSCSILEVYIICVYTNNEHVYHPCTLDGLQYLFVSDMKLRGFKFPVLISYGYIPKVGCFRVVCQS